MSKDEKEEAGQALTYPEGFNSKEQEETIKEMIYFNLQNSKDHRRNAGDETLAKVMAEQLVIVMVCTGTVIDELGKKMNNNFAITKEWSDNINAWCKRACEYTFGLKIRIKELENRLTKLEGGTKNTDIESIIQDILRNEANR